MALRDHEPIVIEEFNGWWDNGDPDNVPLDHFQQADNIQYFSGGFRTRDGLDIYLAQGNVRRLYNYVMPTGDSLLILDTNGDLWHSINQVITYGPLLNWPTATDFGFVQIAGRAYVTPFETVIDPLGRIYQKGVANEFVYVYKGDGTTPRKAAGFPPSNGIENTVAVFNSAVDGKVTAGVHVIAVFDGTDYAIGVVTAPGGKQLRIHNLLPGATRTIYSTRAIDPKDYLPDLSQTFYEVQVITDPLITNLAVDFSDGELTVVAGVSASGIPGLVAQNSDTDGYNDAGFHVFAVVYETDTGFLTAPGPEIFATLTTVDIKKAIDISNIPVSPDLFVVARHIVATKVIPQYNGDQEGFQFFFVPDGNIDNNVDTTKTISFYDADLLEDASHLIDNYSEIPAGVGLDTYHDRMIVYTTAPDISLIGVSAPGEPEAISQVDGLLIVPLDGDPITNAKEFRDVLYIFKKSRTMAFTDNGDVPSTWPFVIIDNGIGCAVHGISTVLDSAGVNIDFLLIANFSGIMLFNGAYARPELTYKIRDYWLLLPRTTTFADLQIMNDTVNQRIYISLPNLRLIYGDYEEGLNPKDIKWALWNFNPAISSIALIDTDVLILGSQQLLVAIP